MLSHLRQVLQSHVGVLCLQAPATSMTYHCTHTIPFLLTQRDVFLQAIAIPPHSTVLRPPCLASIHPNPPFGVWVKNMLSFTRMCPCPQVELAPIQKMIPDELFLHILSYLDPYTLAKIACVTSSWRYLVEVRLLECIGGVSGLLQGYSYASLYIQDICLYAKGVDDRPHDCQMFHLEYLR